MQIKSDQMPSHQNGKSWQVTLNFNGESTKYVREGKSNAVNEQVTVMTTASSQDTSPPPSLEFFFKGKEIWVKLNLAKRDSLYSGQKGLLQVWTFP